MELHVWQRNIGNYSLWFIGAPDGLIKNDSSPNFATVLAAIGSEYFKKTCFSDNLEASFIGFSIGPHVIIVGKESDSEDVKETILAFIELTGQCIDNVELYPFCLWIDEDTCEMSNLFDTATPENFE